jgi:hypothetical protein
VNVSEARRAALALLAERAAGATVCPSEVARAVGGADWRAAMPTVHAAVDALVAEGCVRLSWKGVGMRAREGPYRIGLTQAGPIKSHRLP